MAGRIKVKLGMQVSLGPGQIVLDVDPATPPPKEHSPQFLAHICCGQMVRVTTLPGKSWNLVRPFYRPGKSWKTAQVMESHGELLWLHGSRCHLVWS